MHLDYFTFSGRVIALALMHKVQVGIVFDRVFFLQLAGRHIFLEDIRNADPCLYSSCKQILEMDADFIDSDALGLTFIREVEELGSRRVVELCLDGKSISVTSKNREEYVNLLIQHRFVVSTSDQVSRFARGFADILCNSGLRTFFFQSLELEDLDWMLYGSESAVCVEDWKAHTDIIHGDGEEEEADIVGNGEEEQIDTIGDGEEEDVDIVSVGEEDQVNSIVDEEEEEFDIAGDGEEEDADVIGDGVEVVLDQLNSIENEDLAPEDQDNILVEVQKIAIHQHEAYEEENNEDENGDDGQLESTMGNRS
ncbi:hypothetical protein GH714_009657 [Hevea brasiliensis]|uniref:HECT-type E3 ubiquitin transferase n=1 Tax=Hevea brasiliensis TaxID=3981 RepID=A0A6A6LX42_HEVBR|nr:hypothetical protein GH714_009657 [Hevea brasiliensis]